MFAKYAYRKKLTSNLFPESFPFREDSSNWSKGSHNYPLKFKFVFEACPLSSPASCLSNHVLDGVELIRIGWDLNCKIWNGEVVNMRPRI